MIQDIGSIALTARFAAFLGSTCTGTLRNRARWSLVVRKEVLESGAIKPMLGSELHARGDAGGMVRTSRRPPSRKVVIAVKYYFGDNGFTNMFDTSQDADVSAKAPRGGQSRSTTLRSELLTFSSPLYSMNPSLRNLFMKKFTRDRVVPTISASVSCDTFGNVR